MKGSIRIQFPENTLNSCVNFLSSGIYAIAPADWWKDGSISAWDRTVYGANVDSDNTEDFFNTLNLDRVQEACNRCYEKSKSNCSVNWGIREY